MMSAAALIVGCFAAASAAPAHAEGLNGTFRVDYVGAEWTYNGGVVPQPDTSATYAFTSSCPGSYCFATGTLLPPTDNNVARNLPTITLGSPGGGTWQMEAPTSTLCPEGHTRNQKVNWIVHAQGDPYNFTTLSGTQTVTTSQSCKGDASGTVVQPINVTKVS